MKCFTDSPLGCNSLSWAPFGHHGSAVAAAGPDGNPAPIAKRLVTGSCDNMLRIWKQADNAAEWEVEGEPLKQHVDWVRDVAWAPRAGMPCNVVASCSEDRTVIKWSQRADGEWERQPIATFEWPVWRVSWSLTGNVLAVSAGDSSVTLWKETLDNKWTQISQVGDAGQPGAGAAGECKQ